MKIESRIFEICTGFFIIAALAYMFIAQEVVGTTALWLTAGLSLIIGTYFRFVSRRLEERPEDNPDGEISDGAGDVGFFSPGSYWPLGVAAAAALTAIGLAFWYAWLVVVGVTLILIAVGGLVFEYHRGVAHH
ncbi:MULTISPECIES: cytochrome c oxidase subunit 4 [Pseudonocardia]|uniref:Cytochrome c oxidase polypeptide 4 n=2 Tax=Pseudonocardia TaxID=1847 RepID=A0A1Y2MQD0_PSEAH|nr:MULTISPECIES: cytochrome c oxidase subunit 4 [Pseudonocardia]OSY37425.1 Cytochrome c oxidase polypeptide 4 [Pseudonocardia autotrophica]TDN77250.1 cytochrome c oxidase subunit IV [Pseudonocardia autotrophica]BBG01269.1 cytochrome c oxidase polypeptide 4 [Pseudonocardia autotrophica]GEC25996.1 cytochrome c oxidase polypeptide 4 [Pseudonocardia saturnea]